METMWDSEILELEKRLNEVRRYRDLTIEAMELIKIGTHIIDTRDGIEMVVDGLKNGCNDFEAKPVDGSFSGRGYSYMAREWKIKH